MCKATVCMAPKPYVASARCVSQQSLDTDLRHLRAEHWSQLLPTKCTHTAFSHATSYISAKGTPRSPMEALKDSLLAGSTVAGDVMISVHGFHEQCPL